MFIKNIKSSYAVLFFCSVQFMTAQEKIFDRQVSERLIAHIDTTTLVGNSFVISPDCKRIAFINKEGENKYVVVDNKPGKQYKHIGTWEQEDKIVFSPDSRHIVYVANSNEQDILVVDGIEKKSYPEIRSTPIFSPNGKRIAYVAVDDSAFLVVDSKEGKKYDKILFLKNVVFSPNSERIAYQSDLMGTGFIAVDGIEGEIYGGTDFWGNIQPVFSPDSKSLAYIVKDSGEKEDEEMSLVILNGKEQTRYKEIDLRSLVFSPDSKKLAYIAKKNNKWFTVINGKEGKSYDNILILGGSSSIVFSPDSKRYAFIAANNNKQFVVVDGIEKKQYEGIGECPIFSPDSKRIIYNAISSGKSFIVIDDKENVFYDGIAMSTLSFSADGRDIFYAASINNKFALVKNRKEGKPYNILYNEGHPIISDPQNNFMAFIAKEYRKYFVVVNEQEGKKYDDIIDNLKVDSSNSLHYLLWKYYDNYLDIYLVEEKIK